MSDNRNPFDMAGVYDDRAWHQIMVGTVIVALAIVIGALIGEPIAVGLGVASLAVAYYGANVGPERYWIGATACALLAAAAWVVVLVGMIWS